MIYEILIDGHSLHLDLVRGEHGWKCHLDGEEIEVDAVMVRADVLSLIVHGATYEIRRERTATDLHLWVKNARFAVESRDPRALRSRRAAGGVGEGPQRIVAPMPGKIVRVIAAAGTEVEAGHGVLVIEAMKMQNELKSIKKGTVKQVMVSEGSVVNAGDLLAVVE
jgi:biotin carboxyl carrier protein